MTRALVCLALAVLYSFAPSAFADDAATPYHLSFGPFVGGGRASGDTAVQHTSGYALAIERPMELGDGGFALGPRLEAGNSFVNTKTHAAGSTMRGTYDNRLVGAGIVATQALGSSTASRMHLAATAGKAYAKLSLDQTNAASYSEKEIEGVQGNWYAVDVGAFLPLKHDFGVTLGVVASHLTVDQSKIQGSASGNDLDDKGTLRLTSGKVTPQNSGLEKSMSFDTVAGRVGLAINF